MVNKTKILSDLSKIAVNAMSTFSGIKKEVETIVSLRVNKVINKMKLVKRDEFEAVQAMAIRAREENEALATQLKELEAQLRAQLAGTARPKQRKRRAALKDNPNP